MNEFEVYCLCGANNYGVDTVAADHMEVAGGMVAFFGQAADLIRVYNVGLVAKIVRTKALPGARTVRTLRGFMKDR